ncbi:MAG: amidohydrolase, partial [Leifsonia sp.]|nr:amidohydrolase [Leifsonia sp.]
VAERYPRTRPVFERYGIPYVNSPVPVWEPIIQSAAARGIPLSRLDGLLEELQRAVGS